MDVNVVLDTLLAREPHRADAEAVWAACDQGRLEGHVAAITVTTVFYLVDKVMPRGRAVEAVDACLKAFSVCSVTRDTLLAARAMGGKDFEDDVQIACAVTAGIDAIVTRNSSDFAFSPVRVMSPTELLAALTQQP